MMVLQTLAMLTFGSKQFPHVLSHLHQQYFPNPQTQHICLPQPPDTTSRTPLLAAMAHQFPSYPKHMSASPSALLSPLPAPLRYFSSVTTPQHLQLEVLLLAGLLVQILLFPPMLDRFLPRPLRIYNAGNTNAQFVGHVVRALVMNWLVRVFASCSA